VDRLWPRGVSREELQVAAWLKEIASSDDLRRWFSHDPNRWPQFRERYRQELGGDRQQALLRALAERAATGTVTLVYGARDERHNNAVVLMGVIQEMTG